MGTRDPRVDGYITRSAEFAQPILTHLRAVVHAACPDVEEEIKWGSPSYMYKGMLCGMAAFKQHCTLAFLRAAERGRVVLYSSFPREGTWAAE